MDDNNNDTKVKRRIISHMNQSRRDTLSRYLEYYCLVSPAAIQEATLTDITLEYLILTSGGGRSRHYIPLDPPLDDWADARPRLTQMDQEALAGLGRSSITVDRYVPPRGFHLVVMVACICTFATLYTQRNFLPGSFLYDHLLHRVPFFAAFCRYIQPVLFPVMLAIHAAEAVWLDRSRLRKYNVPRLSRLWWVWIISNSIEGYGAYQRLDRLVKGYEREKSERR